MFNVFKTQKKIINNTLNTNNTSDVICMVIAESKSKLYLDKTLDKFIPRYEKLPSDYSSFDQQNITPFKDESEMLNYCFQCKEIDQTFYWNQTLDNPNKIMVGAYLTNDNYLIISLTFKYSKELEKNYFTSLKKILNSEIGVISYNHLPEFKSGKDFIAKYKDCKYDFDK